MWQGCWLTDVVTPWDFSEFYGPSGEQAFSSTSLIVYWLLPQETRPLPIYHYPEGFQKHTPCTVTFSLGRTSWKCKHLFGLLGKAHKKNYSWLTYLIKGYMFLFLGVCIVIQFSPCLCRVHRKSTLLVNTLPFKDENPSENRNPTKGHQDWYPHQKL